MQKIWLDHYPEGVPPEIDPMRYDSINDMLVQVCERYAGSPAFANFNQVLSYQTLERDSRFFASYLQNCLQLKKGDRVALMMPNLLQYPIVMFGILRAGMVVVNINPLCKARELKHLLRDSGSEAIVIAANFIETLTLLENENPVRHVLVTQIGDRLSIPYRWIVNGMLKYVKKAVPRNSINRSVSFNESLKLGANQPFIQPEVVGEDIAFLQYTGGTTGVSKGAVLTHQNMVANIEQASAWIKPRVEDNKEIIITALPLYHIFSLTANCLTFMRVGALNVLVTNPRDIKGFVKVLSRYAFTAITGVNTLFKALLNHPDFKELNFDKLKITLGGGMAVQHSVAEDWKHTTGNVLLEAYGLTEASPAVCINPLTLKAYNHSVGLPISSTEVSIRDGVGNEVGCDTPGELWVSGPQVMRGYWQHPEETEDAIQAGWLRTGDIATIDKQGYVRIIDRKKDMILVSGFNVYPNEVEDVISALAGVAEVAVIGVLYRDQERVKAFIIRDDKSLTKEAILHYCHQELSDYKVPKEIEFRDDLPKSNVGKILRSALRDEQKNIDVQREKKN